MMIDDDGETGSYGVLTSEPLRMAPVAIPSSFGETRQRLSRNTCPEGRKSKNEKELRRYPKTWYLPRPYPHGLTPINPSKVKRLMSKQDPPAASFSFIRGSNRENRILPVYSSGNFFFLPFLRIFFSTYEERECISKKSLTENSFVRGKTYEMAGKNYEINGS